MTRFHRLLLLAGAGLACQPAAAEETVCPEAEARVGHRVCVHRIPDAALWDEVGRPAAAVDQGRTTVYLVPVDGDARLAPLFVDAGAFPDPQTSLHFDFLTTSFPDLESMDIPEYLALTQERATREWFAGTVTEYLDASGEPSIFGVTVSDPGSDPAETITCQEFKQVLSEMESRIGMGEVAVVPGNDLQRDKLATCDLPVHDPATALDYEPYTRAKGCGTVRRYTLAELAAAEVNAEFGWQDILVVDEAPLDIETIISGVVTGTRQGELSHLNVRSASRGTPNCYVKDAHGLFESWDGQLVELECGATQAYVRAITPDEAQACWEDLKPEPVDVVPADLTYTELMPLLDAPSATLEERQLGVGRFGSKGQNLATLYQRIDPELQLQGFLIPLHYHDQFMQTGTWMVDLGSGLETLTFAETIDRYLDDAAFTSDGALRRQRLEALQVAMESTPCDQALKDAIGTKIVEIFGDDLTMVRFRSSSNAEDALGFNGAGLYDSTSVCLADETDADALGPSRCDPDKTNERDVCRGLTRVWASLWNMKAYEEREWYGIDQRQVAMGILVNTRTKGELANVVAFTGNPLLHGDKRYLVNAQLGELDVVAAVPGVWPEKDLLTLKDGSVTLIERERGSTELPEGEWVLDDPRLEELGGHLWDILQVYPVDEMVSPTDTVLLDTEWKLRPDGRLAIKQVRPFLD